MTIWNPLYSRFRMSKETKIAFTIVLNLRKIVPWKDIATNFQNELRKKSEKKEAEYKNRITCELIDQWKKNSLNYKLK